MGNRLSIFMPVYNFTSSIKENLEKCYVTLLESNINFELIIVDDNSSEVPHDFEEIIDKAKQIKDREARLICYAKGPSRRENLAKSFFLAKYETIGYIDADLSCDIFYFLKAVGLLEEKSADIVIGSRYIEGAKVRRRLVRRIFSLLYNAAIRILFKSGIRDHQCGLKVFRKSTVMPIISRMGYDAKFVRGWFWDAEFLIRAQKAKLKIIEMPVEWLYSDCSTFDFGKEIKCLKAIIKLKRELLKNGL